MSTVNEKMTAIADGIRTLSGGTSSLTLDNMATELNSTSAILHGVNLELTDLIDLIIDSGIGETVNGTNPDFPVVEQIRDLTGNLCSNLDQVFHFFNTNTVVIQNNTSFPVRVYFNTPYDFSFTSKEISSNSTQRISFVQNCVCFIVLNGGMIDIAFSSSNNIELITNEVFSNSQHRYMIFRGINTTPKVEATITIAETGGADEPS